MPSEPETVYSSAVPAPTNPVGAVSVVNQSRDLVAEKQQEQQQDRVEAAQKQSRFMVRKVSTIPKPMSSGPEFENLMFRAAANNPFADLADFSASTFIPDLGCTFYILAIMDHTMASTKRWTDNSMGWVPPISQMYVSILVYVQIFRAMDASNLLPPGSQIATFLNQFINIFPLSELMIPGPLVSLFRNLSAFLPSADEQFGNVSPVVPNLPGWNTTGQFSLSAYNGQYVPTLFLPNISAFISRLRTICSVASTSGMTQGAFSSHLNGPNFCSSLFGTTLSDTEQETRLFRGPGLSFAYADSLPLWQFASTSLPRLSIPQDLVLTGTTRSTVTNEWASFLRFANNEHQWFGSIMAVMAKYSQFFHGSQSLESVPPNCSASGAIKLTSITGNNLHDPATFIASAGNGTSLENGNANAAAHRVLRFNARAVFDARLALKGVPDVHIFAATTFGINNSLDPAGAASSRRGNFWTLGPDTHGRDNIEVLPGVYSAITRDYHSDTRIVANK